MHATLPLLQETDFPPLRRKNLETLQVNLGYLCNQSCVHCHVNAGPKRTELMSMDNIEHILSFLRNNPRIQTLDLTGGAPEMNPHFEYLVKQAVALNVRVIDRCNLTILCEPGYEQLADFLAQQKVEITASLPCYLADNVDKQRGKGTFLASIQGLKKLNERGYGQSNSGLILNLVFNPQEINLPPPQEELEHAYKQHLRDEFNIKFNHLFTIANMPIQRFGSILISKGLFDSYMHTLKTAYKKSNLDSVMCRTLLSIDWQGYTYDCDFNQMLGLNLQTQGKIRSHISELSPAMLENNAIIIGDHCYGCTAGQGSSCGGALNES
ncbi:MAG: radical SAM/Cys-rich domain protein [Gammaproteobacteria bacterium]|nr:radical SAM/Cys-rich domain protein [Gammaproteobacteria bacterium]